MICSTAIECLLNFWHIGLRMGGGIGDALDRQSFKFGSKGLYYEKIIFEILYYIIINLILINIFFGVIVDSFNDMRDKTTKSTEDRENRCFICNLDRFNSKKGDFEDHRKNEHYLFDYVYVYLFLSNKNPQEFSAVETYVWSQINQHRTDWYPEAEDEPIEI